MADSVDTPSLPEIHPSRRAALAGIAGGLATATAVAAGVAMSPASIASVTDEKVMSTPEEWAAAPFEPVDLLESLPSNEKVINPHVMTMRIAAAMLRWDKATLVEKLPELIALEQDGGLDVFADFQDSRKFFEGLASLCETAAMRVLIAGSVIEVNGGWDEAVS